MIFFYLFLLLIAIGLMVETIITHRRNLEKSRKIIESHDYNDKLISWIGGISDLKVKDAYIKFCFDMLYSDLDLSAKEKLAMQKFGKYIPELYIKYRDEKIDDILK